MDASSQSDDRINGSNNKNNYVTVKIRHQSQTESNPARGADAPVRSDESRGASHRRLADMSRVFRYVSISGTHGTCGSAVVFAIKAATPRKIYDSGRGSRIASN